MKIDTRAKVYHMGPRSERLDSDVHNVNGEPCPCEPECYAVCGMCGGEETGIWCERCNNEGIIPCLFDACPPEGMFVIHKP